MVYKYKLSEKSLVLDSVVHPVTPVLLRKSAALRGSRMFQDSAPCPWVPGVWGTWRTMRGWHWAFWETSDFCITWWGYQAVGCSSGPAGTKFYSEMEQPFCVV